MEKIGQFNFKQHVIEASDLRDLLTKGGPI